MCTILTVNRNLWTMHQTAIHAQILRDALLNADGWSLICLDAETPRLDMSVASMDIAVISQMIKQFFRSCGPFGRIFLHSRFATTNAVSLAHTHGFTDSRGTMIMHNGVISNVRRLDVDSFNLVDLRLDHATDLLDDLLDYKEWFANVFLIRPESSSYGVVRMLHGSLHTDGIGNYSTHAVASIQRIVPLEYSAEYSLLDALNPPKTPVVPVDDYPDYMLELDREIRAWQKSS